jgi:hypothetical protein
MGRNMCGVVRVRQPVPSARWYCMDAGIHRRDDARMRLDLTDLGLETAARACRALAYQEGEQATKMKT